MRTGLKAKIGNWSVVGALMVLMSMASAGYVQAQVLNQEEVDWLTYMREEEKLARDVYLELSKMWGSRIFTSIAGSEQTHMDAIKKLLEKYGIADPAADTEVGEFINQELQALYDKLIETGSRSVSDALNVGVLIEETDISDLQAASAVSTHKDVLKVYNNLLAGSLNHLAAFNSELEQL
jgi:hypothetical protein